MFYDKGNTPIAEWSSYQPYVTVETKKLLSFL